jgi:hypothetical protein
MSDQQHAIRETQAYYKGVLEGLWRFAWMRDGVYYVGTTGRTLKEAQAQVDLEMQKAVDALKTYLV